MFYITAKSKLELIQFPKDKIVCRAEAAGVPIKDNYYYLRNWAVSAFETWGLNGNYDGFLDEELQKSYKTFDNSWVCLNHVAYQESDSIGENFSPVYTPEKYVELFMGIDRNRQRIKRPYLEEDIKSGKVTDTSMGCYADYSICTVCGNIAKDAVEYCEHLKLDYAGKNRKGQIVVLDGKRIPIGELYMNTDFVENTIIDDGQGADMNAKIFEVAAAKSGTKVINKDSLYYAIKRVESIYGKLSITSRLLNIMEKHN